MPVFFDGQEINYTDGTFVGVGIQMATGQLLVVNETKFPYVPSGTVWAKGLSWSLPTRAQEAIMMLNRYAVNIIMRKFYGQKLPARGREILSQGERYSPIDREKKQIRLVTIIRL